MIGGRGGNAGNVPASSPLRRLWFLIICASTMARNSTLIFVRCSTLHAFCSTSLTASTSSCAGSARGDGKGAAPQYAQPEHSARSHEMVAAALRKHHVSHLGASQCGCSWLLHMVCGCGPSQMVASHPPQFASFRQVHRLHQSAQSVNCTATTAGNIVKTQPSVATSLTMPACFGIAELGCSRTACSLLMPACLLPTSTTLVPL